MLDYEMSIYEYEQVLLGNREGFVCSFKGTASGNKKEVGNIWRYAVTKLLKWTPEQAVKNLTPEIVKMLHLDLTFSGLDFNAESSFITDYRFVLQYAFPDRITFNLRDQAILAYERAAKEGRFKNNKTAQRLPKNFFTDEFGKDRSSFVLNYLLDKYMFGSMTLKEIYDAFANKTYIMKWLREKHFDHPMRYIYNNTLEFLHYSLPAEKRDDLYYYTKILEKNYREKLKEMNDSFDQALAASESDGSEDLGEDSAEA